MADQQDNPYARLDELTAIKNTTAAACGIIEDLPRGWRGILHDLGRNFGLVQPTPGERAAEARQHFYCEAAKADNSKEAGE